MGQGGQAMTDQDRKDHELAAKAAGYVLTWKEGSCKGGAYCGAFIERGGELVAWRPKDDNADAFALMVDAGICVEPYPYYEPVKHSVICKQRRRLDQMRQNNPTEVVSVYGKHGPDGATRLAVFHCAVEIGRAKQ